MAITVAKFMISICLPFKILYRRVDKRCTKEGATPHEVYCTLRKIQGANLYRIGILAIRGGYLLKVYIEKKVKGSLKCYFNNFKAEMYNIGVTTGKGFFLIVRRHLPFLFNEKYRNTYRNLRLWKVRLCYLHKKDYRK